jgi:hypothetical protein
VAASSLYSQRQRQSGANGDSSVEGASGLGNGGMGVLPCGKGPWYRWRSSTERLGGKAGATGSISDHGLRLAPGKTTPNAGHRPALTGKWAAPLRGSKHDGCSWCTRHPHPRHHPGPGIPSQAVSRRQRRRCCSKARTTRAGGKARPENGGQAGASRKLSRELAVSQGARF